MLGKSLYSWDEIPEERLRDDISRKIVSWERVMAADLTDEVIRDLTRDLSLQLLEDPFKHTFTIGKRVIMIDH